MAHVDGAYDSEAMAREEHVHLGGLGYKAAITYGFDGTNAVAMPVPFLPVTYDYKSLAQTATTDVWTYKTGGSGGTTVATVTYTYTDSTKATIQSIQRS